MKNTVKCPKCGSEEIRAVWNNPMWYRDQYIPVGATMFSAVSITRYVCCGCGYTEEWIDREDIPKLSGRYPRIFPRK